MLSLAQPAKRLGLLREPVFDGTLGLTPVTLHKLDADVLGCVLGSAEEALEPRHVLRYWAAITTALREAGVSVVGRTPHRPARVQALLLVHEGAGATVAIAERAAATLAHPRSGHVVLPALRHGGADSERGVGAGGAGMAAGGGATWSSPQRVAACQQLVGGLAELHASGAVHGALCPATIGMVTLAPSRPHDQLSLMLLQPGLLAPTHVSARAAALLLDAAAAHLEPFQLPEARAYIEALLGGGDGRGATASADDAAHRLRWWRRVDAFALARVMWEVLTAAADGVGSAARSHDVRCVR